MENPTEKTPITTTSLKPNWGFVAIIFSLIFLASFLGGLVASQLFGKSVAKLINKQQPVPEPEKKTIKSIADLRKKDEEELKEESPDDESDLLSQHRTFRQSHLNQ